MRTPHPRTFLFFSVVKGRKGAHVYLKQTPQSFAKFVDATDLRWNEIVITAEALDNDVDDWPDYIIQDKNGQISGAFGCTRGEAILHYLTKANSHASQFSIYPVFSICPGESIKVRVMDPDNPAGLHVVEEEP